MGWAKGVELAKLARRDRQAFDCATWLHKAQHFSVARCRILRSIDKEFRSHSGEDPEENLITLCSNCHRKVHGC